MLGFQFSRAARHRQRRRERQLGYSGTWFEWRCGDRARRPSYMRAYRGVLHILLGIQRSRATRSRNRSRCERCFSRTCLWDSTGFWRLNGFYDCAGYGALLRAVSQRQYVVLGIQFSRAARYWFCRRVFVSTSTRFRYFHSSSIRHSRALPRLHYFTS